MEIKELEGYNFGEAAKKLNEDTSFNRPSFIQKNFASFIDLIIVFFLRIILSAFFSIIWYFIGLKEMIAQSNGNVEALISQGFIPQFLMFAFFVLISGGFYYVFAYSSKYGTTIGGMMYKIKLVTKKTGKHPSFLRSLIRYLLYLFPLVFILIAGIIIAKEKAITPLFVFLGIISVFWYDLWIVNRKITGGVPDLITGTTLVSTKEKTAKRFY